MLMELADDRLKRLRSEASAKASLTIRWQSSNVPLTSSAVTLPPRVVSCCS